MQPIDRRKFLLLGTAAAAGAALPGEEAHAWSWPTWWPRVERSINLLNMHTGERANVTFWEKGRYLPDAMQEINNVLRDFRTGDVHHMDPKLIDLLYAVRLRMHSDEEFHVVSGYRSPHTNAMLRKHSDGVAQNSLHMQGKAIDVYLPDRNLSDLHRVAMNFRAGGVGYYPSSDFVHIDTGRVRYW